MRTFFLYSALLLTSCQLILDRFGPERCSGQEEALCDGEILRACDANNFVIFEPCELGCISLSGDDACDVCGNSLVDDPLLQCDDGAQCDDGSLCASDDECAARNVGLCAPRDGDLCPADCILSICGDANVESNKGEVCDDGNTTAGDGCRADCLGLEVCGDGQFDPATEACDDGNLIAGDGCNEECDDEVCGDAILQDGIGEVCDDGNVINGDGCSADCSSDETCGNSLTDAALNTPEQCDDGRRCDSGAPCLTAAECNPGEQCLPRDGDGCSSACQLENCGDGLVGAGEECDDANAILGDGCDNCVSTCDKLGGQTNPENGHCYIAFGVPVNWNQARAACAAIPLATGFAPHLVTISSSQENLFVRLLNLNFEYWIGLTDQNDGGLGTNENIFRWVTRERLSYFGGFGGGQPDDSFGEDCVALVGASLVWNDRECNENVSYVCEVDFNKQCGNGISEEGEACDDGNNVGGDGCAADCSAFSCAEEAGALLTRSFSFSDSCYVLFDGAENKDWPSAEADCRSRGGHLATAFNNTEHAVLQQLNAASTGSLWFGLNDLTSEFQFGWSTGEPLSFTRFANAEPDNDINQNCGEYRDNDDLWHDTTCGTIHGYLCEF